MFASSQSKALASHAPNSTFCYLSLLQFFPIPMAFGTKSVDYLPFLLLCFALLLCLDLGIAHQSHSHSHSHSDFCGSDAHHHCEDHHHHHHDHDHDHGQAHAHGHKNKIDGKYKLPEELAEEEDMKLYGFGLPHHHHPHDTTELSGFGMFADFPSRLSHPSFFLCFLNLFVTIWKFVISIATRVK